MNFNVLSSLWLLQMIFCQSLYSNFVLPMLSNLFDYWLPFVFITILSLLNRSLWPHICAHSLRWLILQGSSLSIILTLSHKSRRFPFSFHIWSTIPDFSISPLSDVLLTLFLVAGISLLCVLYHNCNEWSTHSCWWCWILLLAWHRRDSSRELSQLWILSWCHMDYISFGSFWLCLWRREDILWWIFKHCLLSSYPGFLEPMLCTLGSCYNGDYILN